MHIDKSEIIASLRSRGLHARADWADRQLPQLVDTRQNNSLLQMLGVDPADDVAETAAERVGSSQR